MRYRRLARDYEESGDEIGQHHPRCGESVRCGDVKDTLIRQHDVTGLAAELGDTNVRAFNDGAVSATRARPRWRGQGSEHPALDITHNAF